MVINPSNSSRNKTSTVDNSCHRRTRCVVERFNGVWKSRFRCLNRSGGSVFTSEMHFDHCCHCVSPSICNRNNLPLPKLLDVNMDDNDDDGDNDEDNNLDLDSGRAVRQQVIDNAFS